MSIKFAIIANPRTGSNHYVDLLNSHPSITCHSEVFHPHAVYMNAGTRLDLLADRNEAPLLFLERLYGDSLSEACGFKIFAEHNDNVLRYVLTSSDIIKIVLYRSNYLAVFSSEKIAQMKQSYVSLTESPAPIDADAYARIDLTEKVHFRVDEFVSRWQSYQNHYKDSLQVLNDSGQKYLLVTYEEFLNEDIFRGVFSWLGLPQPPQLFSRTKKTNSTDILSRFENSEDVLGFLDRIGRLSWACESFILWDGKDSLS